MIASSMGPMHMSANRNYEVQRTNHFEIVIAGLSNDITLMVDSTTLSTITVEPVELGFGNSKVKVAGQASYEDVTVVVKDAVIADIEGQLYDWFKQVYDPETDQVGWAADYKKQARLYEYSVDGRIARSWKLEGIWPTSFEGGEFTYDGGDKRVINMPLAVDKAYPVR